MCKPSLAIVHFLRSLITSYDRDSVVDLLTINHCYSWRSCGSAWLSTIAFTWGTIPATWDWLGNTTEPAQIHKDHSRVYEPFRMSVWQPISGNNFTGYVLTSWLKVSTALWFSPETESDVSDPTSAATSSSRLCLQSSRFNKLVQSVRHESLSDKNEGLIWFNEA